MIGVAEKLNKSIQWSNYEIAGGTTDGVGDSIQLLLNSVDPDSANLAYWQLEGRVVVQGGVYNSAIPTTRVLVAALVEDRPHYIKISIFDLLFQILTGTPVNEESEPTLIEKCRIIATEGLWLFVREYLNDNPSSDAAVDVLGLLDTELDYKILR